MVRGPLLERNPEFGAVTLPLLVGIASAIEHEAVARYTTLVDAMERRGETDMADAFRRMLEEERLHVDAVERWAASLGQPAPDPTHFSWRLPSELFKSWDEVARSARLTPYRAFAIAVDNEQRAFALYSYLAANAEDRQIAAQAEQLALEELRHAALMRRWRRDAWRRERHAVQEETPIGTSIESLHTLLEQGEHAIAARHQSVIAKLRSIGDEESACLLEELRGTLSRSTDTSIAPVDAEPQMNSSVRLLIAAQEPLEALGEKLEAFLPRVEGDLFAEAERALTNVISRISRISLQAERRMK
ncbi:MAG TPA: ferritin family protein [Steroidobacter sp.]|uniref:ferritin-like domain-containing protein n=1 Tax=Steroidobacter sp. TaxID=1978227 RepID=UPI002EDB63C9